jgi:hypothetical protein
VTDQAPFPRPASGQPTRAQKKARKKWRGWWLKQLHNWHWISAAVSLVGMLLFAVTGVTLNHAGSIAAKPVVTKQEAQLPPPLLRMLQAPHAADAALPKAVVANLVGAIGLDAAAKPGEWSDGEVYVALPRPGGDAWLSVDTTTGKVNAEVTNRGWVSYLNDLHKGRNAGGIWFWFIDAFAAACILFTLTGLLLLQMHSRHRPLTWPLVGLGLLVPVLIALLFIH